MSKNSIPQKTISILGCGWLGFPLAQHLIRLGYSVKGSTTHATKINLLKNEGIIPYQFSFFPQLIEKNVDSFFDSNVLFVNIPFKRSLPDPRFYKKQNEAVIKKVEKSSIDFVIFASSTSVYPDAIGEANEEKDFFPDEERGRVLKETEEAFLNNKKFESTVIRFAGLYGPGRDIMHKKMNQETIEGAQKRLNLIHLDDCVQIVSRVIEKNARGEIFNACSDTHPTRFELYNRTAERLGKSLPKWSNEDKDPAQKIVTNHKLKKYLNYTFIHSDPLK